MNFSFSDTSYIEGNEEKQRNIEQTIPISDKVNQQRKYQEDEDKDLECEKMPSG